MSERNHWGLRLRQARKNKGWSQEKLAEEAGVSQSTITKIESGSAARSRYAPQLARSLEVGVNWLTDGIDPMVYPFGKADDDAYALADRPGILDLCAYIPPFPVPPDTAAIARMKDQLPVMEFWHHDVLEAAGVAGSELALAPVLDAAMAPTIRAGEAVLIATSPTRKLIDGQIYMVQWTDKPTLRRAIKRIGGAVSLVADNPDQGRFRPEDLPEGREGIAVHGRVVWRGGWL